MSEEQIPHVEPFTTDLSDPLIPVLDELLELDNAEPTRGFVGQLIAAAKTKNPMERIQRLEDLLDGLRVHSVRIERLRRSVDRQIEKTPTAQA